MANEGVAARELLSVERCLVVLMPNSSSPSTCAQEVLAEGTLRLLALPPQPDTPACAAQRVIISVSSGAADSAGTNVDAGSENGFYYPVIPETPVCLAEMGTCLTFPRLESSGIFGILPTSTDQHDQFQEFVSQLETCGCIVQRQEVLDASVPSAAASLQQGGEALVNAINLGSGLISWGIRQATESAKQTELLAPTSPVHVPESLREEVHNMRQATQQVVMLSSSLVEAATEVVQQVAGELNPLGDQSGESSCTQSFGRASLEAGLDVFASLNASATQLAKELADASSELVSHKYGQDAGEVAREGLHTMSNMMELKSQLSKKNLKSRLVKEAAGSISDGNRCLPEMPAQSADTSRSRGLVLGGALEGETTQKSVETASSKERSGPGSPDGPRSDDNNLCCESETLAATTDGAAKARSGHVDVVSSLPQIAKPRQSLLSLLADLTEHMRESPVASGVAILIVALLVLWRPSLWLFLFSGSMNIALALAVVAVSRRAASLQQRSESKSEARPAESSGTAVDGGGLPYKAVDGLQRLIDGAWPRVCEAASDVHIDILKKIEMGEALPRVSAVRPAAAPESDVVCFDVNVLLVPDRMPPSVDISVRIPGSSTPFVLRMVLKRFQGVVQLYFWSRPPAGRGNGKVYSLIEAALAPDASPFVDLELQAVQQSPMLDTFLPHLQQVALGALESSLLPRFTGFSNRIVVEESQSRGQKEVASEDDWQQKARRAGWRPRAEAELEGFVGDMVRRAGDFARDRAVGAATKTVGAAMTAVGAATKTPVQASRAGKDAAGAALDAAAGAAKMFGGILRSRTATSGSSRSTALAASEAKPAADLL